MKAEELIKQEINRWGPMRFDRFMELALYHPQVGYYNRLQPQRGRKGDYFTSFQVSPLFSQIMVSLVIQLRHHLDASEFSLIEYGSGSGEFLEGVLNGLQSQKELRGMRVFSIERSQAARQHLRKRLSRFARCEVLGSLDDIDVVGGIEGIVFSNEFFDALPFRRLVFVDQQWKDIAVALDQGQLKEIHLDPIAELPSTLKVGEWVENQEIEYRESVGDWFDSLSNEFGRGIVMTFDYGYPRTQLYSPRRINGTWLCYHQHQTSTNALVNIGAQDITAHIDFTQLKEEGEKRNFLASLFCSQGLFFSHQGQNVIQEYLDSASPLEKPQRIGAVQQLLHPEAMGESFWTLIQSKNTSLPLNWGTIPNRLNRLT